MADNCLQQWMLLLGGSRGYLVLGQWKADVEAAGTPSDRNSPMNGVEVCTVAALGVTGPHGVPSSAAGPVGFLSAQVSAARAFFSRSPHRHS